MDFENDFESGHDDNQQNQELQQVPDYEANNQPQQDNFASSSSTQQPQSQNYAQESQKQEKKDLGACGFLQVEYYQPFFNITTEEFKRRVLTALIPKKPDFFEISRENPDLWGPFWIYTTLIFIISTVGNIQAFFKADDKSLFSFDYRYVPLGAIIVYTIGFGTPLLITIFMKCFGNTITAFQTICMYGYSMAVYVPVLLMCVIPYDWSQWMFVALGTAVSIAFMIINLQAEFATYDQNKKYMMFGIIIGVQILFLFFLKLIFLKLMDPDNTHKEILDKTGTIDDEQTDESDQSQATRLLRMLIQSL